MMKNIVDASLGYAVYIPEVTPSGQIVTIHKSEKAGAHKMHAESPDQSELYFEVTAHPFLVGHDALVEQQQGFLLNYSIDGTVSEIAYKTVGRYVGTTFDFCGTLQGKWKERRFLFVDSSARTFRVVYDYTSALNGQVLSRFALLE